MHFYAGLKPIYNPIRVIKNLSTDPPIAKPTVFYFFSVLGIFQVLKKPELFHNCSTEN